MYLHINIYIFAYTYKYFANCTRITHAHIYTHTHGHTLPRRTCFDTHTNTRKYTHTSCRHIVQRALGEDRLVEMFTLVLGDEDFEMDPFRQKGRLIRDQMMPKLGGSQYWNEI
jgi:hypothetical protein